MTALKNKLQALKLAGMAKTLPSRNEYAMANQASYLEFLELLIEDESCSRAGNSYRRRFLKSKLSEEKTIAGYDFAYQPELDKKLVLDLACCRFVREKKNIVFMGNPGVGKTHLANALGLEALRQGYKAMMTHSSDLIEKLSASKGDGTYSHTLKSFLEVDLLIIDELGFKKIQEKNVDEFFEIIRRRYEHGSVILTTNRNFEEWEKIFGDSVLASAIIDRLIHHCHVVRIVGNSYRVKELIKPVKL